MATPASQQQDQADFEDAFNSDHPGQSDAQESAEDPQEEAQESQAQENAEEPTDGGSATQEAPALVIAVDPAAQSNDDSTPTDPKDIQRAKSWEGRLKAKEAELKAREDALKSKGTDESAEDPKEEATESPAVEAIEEASEKVQSGEMTVDQAMASLSNDFGEDFTKMLAVLIDGKATEIATKMADERVGKVHGDISDLTKEIIDDKARTHFQTIADAHPDFMDVASSPEFRAYVEAMPGDQKQKAIEVIQSGRASQINALLDAFKKSNKSDPEPQEQQDAPDQSAMDAAEGVRSKGMQIPDKPAKSDDYAEAWNQF